MQFIHSIENVLSREICEEFISNFEISTDLHTSNFEDSSKKSTDIMFHRDVYNLPEWNGLINKMLSSLDEGLNKYIEKFEVLKYMNSFSLSTFNMQRYRPGEGFYGWHCERNGNPKYINRMLVWMIYLNDVEEGGTEFLYQEHKVKAECGKLLIWPSDWTHTHRGIISNDETKYILTGWYTYTT